MTWIYCIYIYICLYCQWFAVLCIYILPYYPSNLNDQWNISLYHLRMGKLMAMSNVYNELTLERPWLWRACSLFASGKSSKCSSALRKNMHTMSIIFYTCISGKRGGASDDETDSHMILKDQNSQLVNIATARVVNLDEGTTNKSTVVQDYDVGWLLN